MELTRLLFGWQGAVIGEFILTWVTIYFIFMRPRRTGAKRTDSRYYNRYHTRFKGWLGCNGKKREIRGVDLNNAGALITSGVPLAPGDGVFLYIESERLMGWAEVRHCVRRGMFGYHVGLKFRGSLMRATEGDWRFLQQRSDVAAKQLAADGHR
ncbi:MAG: hypothetical protein LAQ69_27935 [Acidobacteriia bacterium]|nr:hypothetical protein [Terriglobia bacterium]